MTQQTNCLNMLMTIPRYSYYQPTKYVFEKFIDLSSLIDNNFHYNDDLYFQAPRNFHEDLYEDQY